MKKPPDPEHAGDKDGGKKPRLDTKRPRTGKDFGHEGTNKTTPVPEPDAQPADELLGTKSKFIPKSPYTRG